jgi:NhaP-type Na+/H+ and K+/H+ antiporter
MLPNFKIIYNLNRFVAIFVLTALYNYIFLFRNRRGRISFRDQIIISYSGLRGVIAFVLALLVWVDLETDSSVRQRNTIITSTLTVIIVTIFLQGTTVRWLVKLLRIEITRQRPEEELKNLTGTQMELRAEEFEMNLKVRVLQILFITVQVKEVDTMLEKLEQLKETSMDMPKNYEHSEFLQGNMLVLKQMLSLIKFRVEDLRNRLTVSIFQNMI